MEIRVLTTEDEIQQAEALDGVRFPRENSIFIGAINSDGKVVGRIVLMSLVHLEGTIVAEDYRGSSAAIRLVAEAEQTLMGLGFNSAIAYTPMADAKIGAYMQRVGYQRFPVEVWQKFLPIAKAKEA